MLRAVECFATKGPWTSRQYCWNSARVRFGLRRRTKTKRIIRSLLTTAPACIAKSVVFIRKIFRSCKPEAFLWKNLYRLPKLAVIVYRERIVAKEDTHGRTCSRKSSAGHRRQLRHRTRHGADLCTGRRQGRG